MFAIKGNKEVKILEVQKDEYIKKGYTILNDKLETIERPQNQLENIKAENEALKKIYALIQKKEKISKKKLK